MNSKECELVTEEFVQQESNYNLCVGGKGGWSYVNRKGINQPNTIQAQKRKSAKCRAAMLEQSEELKAARVSKLNRHWHKKFTFAGQQHTDKAKEKISAALKGKGAGSDNSQFGTRWITDGQTAKKITDTDVIPDGWRPGRK